MRIHQVRGLFRNLQRLFPVQDAPHGIGGWEKNPAWQGYKGKMIEWLRATLR